MLECRYKVNVEQSVVKGIFSDSQLNSGFSCKGTLIYLSYDIEARIAYQPLKSWYVSPKH